MKYWFITYVYRWASGEIQYCNTVAKGDFVVIAKQFSEYCDEDSGGTGKYTLIAWKEISEDEYELLQGEID